MSCDQACSLPAHAAAHLNEYACSLPAHAAAHLNECACSLPAHAAAHLNEYVCSLPAHARAHAAAQLNESEASRAEDIAKMQQWLHSQPHLHARTDPISVLRFLRGCKFNVERTRKKLTNYYVMRRKVPEWFTRRDPCLPQLQELLDLGIFLPLLQRDKEGRLVVLIRAAAHNPRRHLQSDFFKLSKMVLEVALEEDEQISVFGVVAVVDLDGISLAHSLQLTPPVISKAVHAWQDCYPVRTRSMDFINAPSYVNVVLNVFRRFMTEKMRSRVHVHGRNLNSLHNIVPSQLLPQEYGGLNGKLQDLIDHWKQRVVDRRDWLLDDEKLRAD